MYTKMAVVVNHECPQLYIVSNSVTNYRPLNLKWRKNGHYSTENQNHGSGAPKNFRLVGPRAHRATEGLNLSTKHYTCYNIMSIWWQDRSTGANASAIACFCNFRHQLQASEAPFERQQRPFRYFDRGFTLKVGGVLCLALNSQLESFTNRASLRLAR